MVKSFSLWIAATITTHSVSCRGDSEPYSNNIYILKGKVSEKKARVDILLLNSQVNFPFTPDGRLCQAQGFTWTHRALVGTPTALVRGALQPCMAAHRGGHTLWKSLTKVVWSSKTKHTILTWDWSWDSNTQRYFNGSDWEVGRASSDMRLYKWAFIAPLVHFLWISLIFFFLWWHFFVLSLFFFFLILLAQLRLWSASSCFLKRLRSLNWLLIRLGIDCELNEKEYTSSLD